MKIAVYTVILDNYDNLRPPVVTNHNYSYVCFSDRPRNVPPWQTHPFPMLFSDPARNSRIPKMLPHLLLPEVEFSIYMDGAFVPRIDPCVAVMQMLGDADVAMFAHPGGHKSIHDERNFYQKQHGYVPDEIESQYQRYIRAGVPDTGQFWAGGLVIRRHNAQVEAFNERWMREYLAGSHNDQFALYRAVVESNVKVRTIDGVATMDDRFGYCLHADSGCGDNPKFEADNAAWQARVNQIRSICGPPLGVCA